MREEESATVTETRSGNKPSYEPPSTTKVTGASGIPNSDLFGEKRLMRLTTVDYLDTGFILNTVFLFMRNGRIVLVWTFADLVGHHGSRATPDSLFSLV